MITKTNIPKPSGDTAQSPASVMPFFMRLVVAGTFTGASLGGLVSIVIYKTNRALALAFMVLSGLAATVGAGLCKRKSWALPATQILFAVGALFGLLQVLFRGFGATASNPQVFANVPSTIWGWLLWSLLNVQGAAPIITAVVMSLMVAVWMPSSISLQGQSIRSYFALPAAKVAGRPLIICVSLCFLLPVYGLAIPVSTYESTALAGSGPLLQWLSSMDAWCILLMTIGGIRVGIQLWSCQPGAVRRCKRLLAIRFIYSLCFGGLLFIVVPGTAADWLVYGSGRYFFLTGIASGVLLMFLHCSNI